MQKNELVSVMKRYGDRQEDLAKYIGISLQQFNKKINQKDGADFTRGEIQKIIEKYNLSAEDIHLIFFTSDVSSEDMNNG